MEKIRLCKVTTVPSTLRYIFEGQLRFLAHNGFEVIAVSADGPEDIRCVIEREGISHYVVPLRREIAPAADVIALIRLVMLFLKLKPVIVHSHLPKAGFIAMAAAWIARIPIRLHTIAGIRQESLTGITGLVVKLSEKATAWFATQLYPNSQSVYQFSRDINHISPLKMKVIGQGSTNGIDMDIFNPGKVPENSRRLLRSRYDIADDAFVFLFVGRLVKDKGIDELLRAYVTVKKLRPQARLVLAGSREGSDSFSPLAERVLQDMDVVKLGWVYDLPSYYTMADLVVFPTYREGLPNVLLQAGAMGVPVIATDVTGCRDVITHQQTGILVPPQNSAALAAAMVELCDDPAKRIALSENLAKHVRRNFDRRLLHQEILKEYRRLIHGRQNL